jgi:hypothetical protein
MFLAVDLRNSDGKEVYTSCQHATIIPGKPETSNPRPCLAIIKEPHFALGAEHKISRLLAFSNIGRFGFVPS